MILSYREKEKNYVRFRLGPDLGQNFPDPWKEVSNWIEISISLLVLIIEVRSCKIIHDKYFREYGQ